MEKTNIYNFWFCIGKLEGLFAGIENGPIKEALGDVVRTLVEIAEEEAES